MLRFGYIAPPWWLCRGYSVGLPSNRKDSSSPVPSTTRRGTSQIDSSTFICSFLDSSCPSPFWFSPTAPSFVLSCGQPERWRDWPRTAIAECLLAIQPCRSYNTVGGRNCERRSVCCRRPCYFWRPGRRTPSSVSSASSAQSTVTARCYGCRPWPHPSRLSLPK